MNVDLLEKEFENFFGEKCEKIFFAPGRVNLIGEHTDYNGGNVLPCAISFGTYLFFSQRKDNILSFASTNFDFKAEIAIDELDSAEKNWVKYPEAVVDQFLKKKYEITGMNLLFAGNIPTGAGLSSSASVELVTSVAINEHFGFRIPTLELVKMSQKAENNFVGVNCGIMDQFAVGMGKQNTAMYLNCASLDFKYVDLNLENHTLIIADTKKQRLLADSKYNERCHECEQALSIINEEKKIDNLCELSIEEFDLYGKQISDKTIFSRAKHVVYEHHRVKSAIKALQNNTIEEFGQLMIQSHNSLHYDYEVTGKELDTMFELALQCEGVIGSRMTGAGFGGCTVSLVENTKIQQFKDFVSINYKHKIGVKPEFYIVKIGDGASRIK